MRVFIIILAGSLLIGCHSEFALNPSGTVSLPTHPITAQDFFLATPEVIIGQNEYTRESLYASVPDSLMFPTFCRDYGKIYSDSLKSILVSCIVALVDTLSGSSSEMKKCLEATGELQPGVRSLPFKVERASFEGKVSWIFQFVWGPYADSLGHYRCYVMDAANADSLYFITCR